MLWDWRAHGEKELCEEARQTVRKRLKSYDFKLVGDSRRYADG
jgi:hypothetical protein